MPGIQNSKSTLDFLGALGTRRGDVVIEKSAQGLVKLAAFLIEKASNNLERKRNVATGDTISSMKVVNLDFTGTKLSVDVQILSTYKFLDKGVKGTEGGTGKYKFKVPFPSGRKTGKKSKFFEAIYKWVQIRNIRGTQARKYRPYGKAEQKDVNINATKSAAFAITANIKKKGIRPTFFFTNAVKDTQKQAKKIIGQGFKLDIIQNLKLN